jgi:hypothetical protein
MRSGAVRRLAIAFAISLASCAMAASASAALKSHGQQLHLVPNRLRSNTNSSSNWFGYNQGALEQSGKLFNSITGIGPFPPPPSTGPSRRKVRRTGSGSAGGASTPAAR